MMLTLLEMILRLGNAMLLGTVVGLERETHDRPAGLRTHMIVTLASAVFMIVSTDFTYYFASGGLGEGMRSDPSRIASYVVAGMGFLGAGTIIHGGRGVKGLTTASTLWLSAAMGLAVGAGMYSLAWSSCLMAILSLVGFRGVERLMDKYRTHPIKRRASVEMVGKGQREELLARLGELKVQVTEEDYDLNAETGKLRLGLSLRLPLEEDVANVMGRVGEIVGVTRVEILKGKTLPGEEE